jgi:putative transposase
LCIEKFTNTPISEKIDPNYMRREISARVRAEALETNQKFVYSNVAEAIRDAGKTKSAIISKRTKGLPCGFNYKSRKKSVQSYCIQYFSPNMLSKRAYLTEEVPPESHTKMARVVHEHGRWYVCVQKLVDIKSFNFESQELKVCAVDPGVRCFATCYSMDKLNEIGNNFCVNKLVPIALKIRRLIGLRQKLINTKKTDCIWYQQRMRGLNKSLDKLRAKRKDLINELHKYCVWFLVTNYDVILIPKFETSNMVRKGGRRISRGIVARMLDLSHYKFQCMLRWMATKYGKLVVTVNESYTSKTCSWNGKIVDNLRGSSTISDGNILVNRDHNGARGILLRALTRQLMP